VLKLISPQRTVLLSDHRGNGTPFNGTVFDSEAVRNINAAGSDPFEGRFHPEWSMENFDGTTANGTWYLEASDTVSGNTGTITGWQLQLTYANANSDGNDVVKGQSGARDIADYSGRSAAVSVTLTSGADDGQTGETDNIGNNAADVEDGYGGLGADHLVGAETVYNDLRGNTGNDTIEGLGTYDLLFGGDGNDKLYGGGGWDTLYGGNGADLIDGGDGTDWAKFVYGAVVTVNLSTQTATGEGSDTLVSIENARGTQFNDTLYGSSVGNTLDGYRGNDTIDARDGTGGNDTVDGGAGTDSCQADSGDTIKNCP
jgi:Ca2+-binding RTX toxin-like protein